MKTTMHQPSATRPKRANTPKGGHIAPPVHTILNKFLLQRRVLGWGAGSSGFALRALDLGAGLSSLRLTTWHLDLQIDEFDENSSACYIKDAWIAKQHVYLVFMFAVAHNAMLCRSILTVTLAA